jgi:hypothetical protein
MSKHHRSRLGVRGAVACGGWISLLLLTGCQTGPPLVEVSGQVLQQGQPLDDVVVIFTPEPGQPEAGTISTGRTDREGHYTLSYRGEPQREGAVMGVHRVVLIDPRMENQRDPAAPPPRRIPARYRSAGTTPLRHEVSLGNPPIDIQVAAP